METEGRPTGPSDFGALLRRYRLTAGLSQEALAERARLSTEGVSALERGFRRTPQRGTLALLANALALDGERRREIQRKLRRGEYFLAATRMPRSWSGRGATATLLRCHSV